MNDFRLNDVVRVNGFFPNPQFRGMLGRIVDLNWKTTPTLLDGQIKLEGIGADDGVDLFVFPREIELLASSVAESQDDEGITPFEVAGSLFQSGQARWYEPDTKPTNPKDAIGSDKLPLHLWPMTASAAGAVALLDGMLKYGRSNWREAGVRVTIYVDALERHVTAYLEGEECDPDSGLPHLWHALACLGILVDADAAGKLVDDRNYNGAGWRPFVEALTPHVARLKEKHAHRSPRHFTIGDNALEEPAETR